MSAHLAGRSLADLYVSHDVLELDDHPKAARQSGRRVLWDTVCEEGEGAKSAWRAVLLGGSGHGKSVVLKMTAARLARTALGRLDGGVSPAEVPIPIYLRLDDLAEHYSRGNNGPSNDLREAIQANLLYQPAVDEDKQLARALAERAHEFQT